jgi:hypothetical protein
LSIIFRFEFLSLSVINKMYPKIYQRNKIGLLKSTKNSVQICKYKKM